MIRRRVLMTRDAIWRLFPAVGDGQVWEEFRVRTKACLEFLTANDEMNRARENPSGNHAPPFTPACRAVQHAAPHFIFRRAKLHEGACPGFYLILLRQQHRLTKSALAPRFVTQP